MVHSIRGAIHHQHNIRMVILQQVLPEPTEVFSEKIEHKIIDLSNSPAVSSSSSTILSSPPFRPSNVHKQSPGIIVHTHTLLAITCGEPFKSSNKMNVLYRIENDDSYSYILNIFEWSNKVLARPRIAYMFIR